MQKAKLEFNNFSSGVVTDASKVATPEGVVLSCVNYIPQRNGAVHLRPPLRRESETALFSADFADAPSYGYVWDSPDGDTSTQLVILQYAGTFKVLQRARAVGSTVQDITPDAYTHVHGVLQNGSAAFPTTNGTSTARISCAVVGRFCVITGLSNSLEYDADDVVHILEYDRTTGNVVAWYDHIWVRDFFGVQDDRPGGRRCTVSELTTDIVYNLFNAGWWNQVTGPAYVINSFYSSNVGASTGTVCAAQSVASGSPVALTMNGSEIIGGIWDSRSQPRSVSVVTPVGAGGEAYVNGTDASGAVISETMTLLSGSTNNSTLAFATVTSITVDIATGGPYSISAGSGALYPGDNDNWAYGVYNDTATTRNWSANFLVQAPEGSGEAPNGSYVVPLHYRSLDFGTNKLGRAVFYSHIKAIFPTLTDLLEEDKSGRPGKVCSFAGRAWYTSTRQYCTNEATHKRSPDVQGIVSFSRVIDNIRDVTKCYGVNDPTSPEFNTLLADDGGYVRIQNAGEIHSIVPMGNAVLVLAENGVWGITGGSDGFTAVTHQVIKLSDAGCVAPNSVVQTGDMVFYVSSTGVYVVSATDQGQLAARSLTDEKNRTLVFGYSDLTTVVGGFDSAHSVVRLLFTENNERTSELCIDTVSGAVYTCEVVPGDYRICGYVEFPAARVAHFASGDRCPNLGYVLANENGVTADVYFGYMRYDDLDGSVYSWEDEGGSYAEAAQVLVGHISLGDIQTNKYAVYLEVFCERTEDTYTVSSGDVSVNHESSCLVDAYWEWANHSASPYKSQQFEAYRYRRPFLGETTDGTHDFNYGQSVIWTKNKLRGHGKTLAVRLSPSANKDSRILGWMFGVGGNQ